MEGPSRSIMMRQFKKLLKNSDSLQSKECILVISEKKFSTDDAQDICEEYGLFVEQHNGYFFFYEK